MCKVKISKRKNLPSSNNSRYVRYYTKWSRMRLERAALF